MMGDDNNPESPAKPDYVVGYKRPPKETQFQKGNIPKRGERRKKKELVALDPNRMVFEALQRPVPVIIDGKRRKMPLIQAHLEKAVNNPEPKSLKVISTLLSMFAAFAPPDFYEGGIPVDHGAEFRRRIEALAKRQEEVRQEEEAERAAAAEKDRLEKD